MGHKAYKIPRNIVTPNKPTDVSFKNFISAMTSHFSLPPSEIVQQFQFNSQVRKQGKLLQLTLSNEELYLNIAIMVTRWSQCCVTGSCAASTILKFKSSCWVKIG